MKFNKLLLATALLSSFLGTSAAFAMTEVVEVDVMTEQKAPSAPAHHKHSKSSHARHEAMNVMGRLKGLKIVEENGIVKVDITFASKDVIDFTNTPAQMLNEKSPLTQVDAFVIPHLRDYRIALGFPGKVASFRPIHLEKLGDETLRLTLSPHTTLGQLHQLDQVAHALEKQPLAFALFIDYGATPHSHDASIPFKRRTTFFLTAEKGVDIRKQKSDIRGQELSITFKDVDGVMALSAKGHRHKLSPDALVHMIGAGKPPFHPNGSFFILKDGKPAACTFAFDKAHYDPKTHTLSFKVTMLKNEATSKLDPSCLSGEHVLYDDKVTAFLDFGGAGGGAE